MRLIPPLGSFRANSKAIRMASAEQCHVHENEKLFRCLPRSGRPSIWPSFPSLSRAGKTLIDRVLALCVRDALPRAQPDFLGPFVPPLAVRLDIVRHSRAVIYYTEVAARRNFEQRSREPRGKVRLDGGKMRPVARGGGRMDGRTNEASGDRPRETTQKVKLDSLGAP